MEGTSKAFVHAVSLGYTKNQLAQWFGVSPRSIARWLKQAEEAGVLKVTPIPGKESKIELTTSPPELEVKQVRPKGRPAMSPTASQQELAESLGVSLEGLNKTQSQKKLAEAIMLRKKELKITRREPIPEWFRTTPPAPEEDAVAVARIEAMRADYRRGFGG